MKLCVTRKDHYIGWGGEGKGGTLHRRFLFTQVSVHYSTTAVHQWVLRLSKFMNTLGYHRFFPACVDQVRRRCFEVGLGSKRLSHERRSDLTFLHREVYKTEGAFCAGLYKYLTETGNWAWKASATHGFYEPKSSKFSKRKLRILKLPRGKPVDHLHMKLRRWTVGLLVRAPASG